MDLAGRGGGAYNSDMMSPDQPPTSSTANGQRGGLNVVAATPTMQQRIKALGVATPLALSSPVRR